MKRKADTLSNGKNGKIILKKRAKKSLSDEDAKKAFRKGLFDKEVLKKYTKEYANSEPYKHQVISPLIDDALLRSVRNEIRENVHFTPKETDIYKIHQSGDLANLDGLDDGALEKLPSLLRLRDALYSSSFRKYVAKITGSGELSGRKTDMAINIYTPGCHLLCHDDVIGSRKVSYILYLTDPDVAWKEEWGGALRLFPTKEFDDDGVKTITPSPDTSKIIPPAWNQLSFFAVQPGQSFHDVEEVYHAASKEQLEKDGGRVRMAISGWFHIPQIGEEGYVKGAEEKWGKNSSLMQLQGNPDKYDFPKEEPVTVVESTADDSEEIGLEEADLDFLLKYMAPTYLTPDTLDQVAERFQEESNVTLDGLLSVKFAAKVREYVEAQEAAGLPESTAEIEKGFWKVAKPPHKHRFLYQQPSDFQGSDREKEINPIGEILNVLLPSTQFRKWLEIATSCQIENYDLLARRFRKGSDYALAKNYEGKPRLEVDLGLTPTTGWGDDGNDDEENEDNEGDHDEEEEEDEEEAKPKSKSKEKEKSKGEKKAPEPKKESEPEPEEEDDVGGHLVFMAGDDENDEDAAIYKAAGEEEDDGVLFTMPAAWNKMSIVLRDSGVLKFVKYVSKNAKGDRWDISGALGVKEEEDEGKEEEEEGEEEEDGEGKSSQGTQISLEDSDEEGTFNGFPDSEPDSDSD
ncbi:90a84e1f-dc5d-441d-bc02-70eeedc4396c [Sclerotinia trifoliorum]|uniref:uS12 prolyl 3,4-dihydroxylase n=1 Tax=Sclerotinia trifoliorum TaxID=28548 RepID=A0A8H2ZP50_9HELO|nr:90a84e1f-dc5d-441d-bc02-70eeedc4396c [Sclerotinia trifoliorum]